jgi:hypothetical protein
LKGLPRAASPTYVFRISRATKIQAAVSRRAFVTLGSCLEGEAGGEGRTGVEERGGLWGKEEGRKEGGRKKGLGKKWGRKEGEGKGTAAGASGRDAVSHS